MGFLKLRKPSFPVIPPYGEQKAANKNKYTPFLKSLTCTILRGSAATMDPEKVGKAKWEDTVHVTKT